MEGWVWTGKDVKVWVRTGLGMNMKGHVILIGNDKYDQERALKDRYEHGMTGKCGHLQGRTLKCG